MMADDSQPGPEPRDLDAIAEHVALELIRGGRALPPPTTPTARRAADRLSADLTASPSAEPPADGSPRAPKAKRPRRSADSGQLLVQIDAKDRVAFYAYLLDSLEGAPSVADIHRFAKKAPDRWAQMVTMMAKLSGFRDQVDVRAAVVDLSAMSDAQLRDLVTEQAKALSIPAASDPTPEPGRSQ